MPSRDSAVRILLLALLAFTKVGAATSSDIHGAEYGQIDAAVQVRSLLLLFLCRRSLHCEIV
jgi:hypothetical protein